MLYLDLTLNLTLLVALTIVSAFIDERWPRDTRAGVLMQGVLFGAAAVIGMLRPVHIGHGLIFDGRSVMVSLSALYYGPWAASIASLSTTACRVGIGGGGTVTGVLVIVSSACIGLAARLRLKPEVEPPSTRSLYLFGLAVHLAMVGLMFSLPMRLALHTIERIAFPVILAYPLATVLAGKILSDRVSTIRIIEQLQQSRQNLHITLQSIGDAVISTDMEGRISLMNPASEALTGWRSEQALGKPLEEVFHIVNEYTRAKVENPAARVLREGEVVGLANHTLLIARDGVERPIADSGAPIRAVDGTVSGVVLVFRDQTSERREGRFVRARMNLLEFAATHTLNEFLSRALDEIRAFVESPIGFYHFLESDQKTLSRQQWSTQTLKDFCLVEGKGRHYHIDTADIRVECVRERKPVIHNDYSSLEHKKGMPEGYDRVVRELVVPVMRNDKIVAVLGVGDKPRDYTEKDAETVAYLADVTWEIVERKRAENARREKEEINNAILNQATEGIVLVDCDTLRFVEFNDAACNGLGYSREEFDRLTLFDVQGIQTRQDLTELADRVRRNGSARFENRQRRKDGSLRDVMTSAVSLPESGCIMAIWLDISERRRMEDALRDEELRLRTILQTVNEGFWLIDNETATIDVNPRMCAILRRNREEILGRTIFEFVDHENKAIFEQQIGLRRQGKFGSYEIALCRGDGSSVFCEFKASPLLDRAGNRAGSFAMVTDITERKQAEGKLRESEMRFLTVFHAGPTPTSLTRFSDGMFLDVNDQFLNLFGYSREEVIGSNPLALGMWASSQDRAEMIEKLIKESETGSFETQYCTKNGEIKHVLVVARLISIGEEQYILGLSTDITEKKRAEEEVLRLYRQNQLILDATADGIVGLDLAGKIVFANPSAARMLGYSIEELIDADLHELAHHTRPDGSPYPADECFMLESMRTGSESRLEDEWFWRKDGRSFPCILSITPIKEDGRILGGVVSFQDITARKRAQEEKEKLETHLRQVQRLESIGTLAGGIAHDFNNILAPIMGYAEMALADLPQADSMRFGQEQILGAALRARDLVSQILAFGRSGMGQRLEPVEISSVVKEALKLIRASLPSSIEIPHSIEGGVANADPTQIHQVLMNLCTNAAHSMGDKGILEVSLSRVDLRERDLADQLIIGLKPGPHLKLCVSDTGAGIDQAILGRIFDPYFTTKAVGKGTGLGLFVVSGIVNRHQGAITVESEVGAGTTFTVYLPAIEDEATESDGYAQAPETGTERILLVDDEQVVVKMAARILQRLGYTVTEETDAGHAVKVFKADPAGFDLVITDYAMPRLTGMELAVAIRRIRPDMPIILSTGFTERETVDRANELGLEILMKPYSVTQLSETVRKILDL